MIVAGKDQIQGWKEIATFLGRDERTVKRWEKQRGLPVRRIPGVGRANVYILVSDLEAWLASDQLPSPSLNESPEPTQALDEPAPPHSIEQLSSLSQSEATISPPEPQEETSDAVWDRVERRSGFFRRVPLSLALTLGIVGLGLVGLALHAHDTRHPEAGLSAKPTLRHAAYSSSRPGADQLYLQGVYFYEQRTPESLEGARRSFEEVIAKDPNYAPAYTGLADTYLLLREYSTMPPDVAYARAKVAAERAIALDPNLPEAHASLGFIDFFSSWNAAAATQEFQTALRLDPNCALAHHWYGSMLTHQGLYSEALGQLNLAQRLQPTSSAILASKAFALGLGGHRDEASRALQALVTTDPKAASPHRSLAIVSLIQPRDIPRYLEERRRFAELRNDREDLALLAVASDAFHRGGEPAMWSVLLVREKQLHPAPEQPTYFMAELEAALGHDDQALHDLDILAGQRQTSLIGLAIDPFFVHLRPNPGFQSIRAALGFPRPS